VAYRFPDGQLFVNLRGFDPSASPMSPAEAVRGFLDAFEVPAERIPVGLEAQASLYRSILAGRRVLVVLDNARDAAQVRPLLPGSGGCFVLVTSRNRLTSLIAVDGARPLAVDLLPVGEARELLRVGSGRRGSRPSPRPSMRSSRCARGCRWRSAWWRRGPAGRRRPRWRRWPRSCGRPAARCRRSRTATSAPMCGRCCPGPTNGWMPSRHACSGCWACTPARTSHRRPRRAWPARTRHGPAGPSRTSPTPIWSTRQVPGRFGFHDLLRAYAAELARSHEGDTERDAARERLLEHYLHTAHAMNRSLHPREEPMSIAAPGPGVTPETAGDHRAALAWFEAEHAVLMAAVQLAVTTGHLPPAWQLPQALNEFLLRGGHWSDRTALQETALDAAPSGRRPGRAGPGPQRARPCPGLARAVRGGARPPPPGPRPVHAAR